MSSILSFFSSIFSCTQRTQTEPPLIVTEPSLTVTKSPLITAWGPSGIDPRDCLPMLCEFGGLSTSLSICKSVHSTDPVLNKRIVIVAQNAFIDAVRGVLQEPNKGVALPEFNEDQLNNDKKVLSYIELLDVIIQFLIFKKTSEEMGFSFQ